MKESNEKQSRKLLEVILFPIIGILLVLGTFLLEFSLAEETIELSEEFSEFDYEKANILPNSALIRFDDVADLHFDNDVVAVNSGNYWANFELVHDAMVLDYGNVVLMPRRAAFSADFKDGNIDLKVFAGDVYVGFLLEDIDVDATFDQFSPEFMNVMLVPQNSEVNIFLDKVDERIALLLNKKLKKEFKFAAISEESRDLVEDKIRADKDYMEGVRRDLEVEILAKLPEGTSFLDGFVFWAEENLTFIPDKKDQLNFDRLFGFLDESVFHAVQGDDAKMTVALSSYEGQLKSLGPTFKQNVRFRALVNIYIQKLSLFDRDHSTSLILDKLFDGFKSRREIAAFRFWNVYRSLQGAELRDALIDYESAFEMSLGIGAETDDYRRYIEFQNNLMSNLFLRYADSYADRNFELKSMMEEELLRLYDFGQGREEVVQGLVEEKIDYLSRLQKFFFEGSVGMEEAKKIILRLVSEADSLIPIDTSNVAIFDVYRSDLNDVSDFWGYLKSPEYNNSKTYGLTHFERFESYLLEADRFRSILELTEDVLGVGEVVSLGEVETEIRLEFDSFGVSSVEFSDFDDVSQRFVDMSGVLLGIKFSAIYDRNNGTLREVYRGDDLVIERSIKVSNLLSLFSDVPEEEKVEVEEELNIETNSQRIARNYVVEERFPEYGISVGLDGVSLKEGDELVYEVRGAIFDLFDEVDVNFDYYASGEMVRSVYIVGELIGTVVLHGEYRLEDLLQAIEESVATE
ncbi:hypothetical protein JKY72_04135 [Candidatus Gracilibacteria bacterium]|nr:hypothetical protein [Candidatus Gracilibacteria bacterium]